MKNLFKSVFELFAPKPPVSRAGAGKSSAKPACCAGPDEASGQNQSDSNGGSFGSPPPCCGKNSDTQELQTRSL